MKQLLVLALLWFPSSPWAAAQPWPEGVVPYRLDASVGGDPSVGQAAQLWCQRGVNLEFRNLGASWLVSWAWAWGLDRAVLVRVDPNLKVFAKTTLGPGVRRELVFNPALSSPGWLVADLAHEWGHVLGLTHEHQRWDRDRYVVFPPGFLEGLSPDRRADYALIEDPPKGQDRPYDYGSIMHYSSNVDGNRMVRRDTGALVPGVRTPSPGDLDRLLALGYSPQELP